MREGGLAHAAQRHDASCKRYVGTLRRVVDEGCDGRGRGGGDVEGVRVRIDAAIKKFAILLAAAEHEIVQVVCFVVGL